jgi:hypothetical protein
MNRRLRRYYVRLVCTFAVAVCGTAGAASAGQMRPTAFGVLSKGGQVAEDSFYSCVLNGYALGLSLAQAREECTLRLLEDEKKGFGGGIGDLPLGSEAFFDPASVSGACNTGDPTLGQTSGSHYTPGHGVNTWGAESKTEYGLSKEESTLLKRDALAILENESVKFDQLADKASEKDAALMEAKASGDRAAIEKADAEAKAANAAAIEQAGKVLDAIRKANQDPNKKPVPQSKPVAGGSACQNAIDAARELLRECQRTQWKDFRCQGLHARMNQCPDPALILVDPDQGYACGAKLDPEAVKDAWVAKCEQLVKFGPDAANPCLPPTLDQAVRFGQGKIDDICRSPYAQTDPDNDACSTVTIAEEFGKIDIQEIIVFGLNTFGGPIVVLPKDPLPPPRPGGDPRPK